MAEIPQTSITLLHALAGDTANDQWYKFYEAYKGAIVGFVHDRYPTLDPDDVLQETMRALAKCLPAYQYTPDEKGHFRNYLMGIVKHKAVDALRKRVRESNTLEKYSKDPTVAAPRGEDYAQWMLSAKEAAIDQLMADTRLATTTRTIFEHAVLLHEPPEQVARQFGTTRNNVDQIKNRLIKRLKEIVQSLTAPEDGQAARD